MVQELEKANELVRDLNQKATNLGQLSSLASNRKRLVESQLQVANQKVADLSNQNDSLKKELALKEKLIATLRQQKMNFLNGDTSGGSSKYRFQPTHSPPQLLRKTWRMSKVEHEGMVYLIGGDGLSCIEVYDIEENKFMTLPYLMPEERSRHTSCIIGETIYNFGGTLGEAHSPSASVEAVNLGEGIWRPKKKWKPMDGYSGAKLKEGDRVTLCSGIKHFSLQENSLKTLQTALFTFTTAPKTTTRTLAGY
eukprot:TRINITY_DN1845_c0_g1_i1.p1 TRINITY_DN1845_c0_g1~~TRINITY_DN1845_c0_g1_i1.p1  ORF type:complete len:252 (+),score=27.09 TRINITY_DN1845_c0_g1_i1:202-957(+)